MTTGPAYPLGPLHNLLGVWTWNVKTNIVITCQDVCEYVNIPAECGLHGVDAERFVDAIHPDDRKELARRVDAAMAGEDTLVAEYRIRSKRHGTRWVRSSGHCFRDDAGQPTHISGYLTQIRPPESVRSGEQQTYAAVIELLIKAREMASMLDKPMLGKLIGAVLVEAGYQLARVLKKKG